MYKTPMTGGVTDKETTDVFNTSGGEPVRDRKADFSKGRPVTRFFTKDGTPVEPSSVKPSGTPYHLQSPDTSIREDVIEAVEYVDEDGATVTHDSLDSNKTSDSSSDSASDSTANKTNKTQPSQDPQKTK